jgi:DNA polymerase-3 subunit epsilon
MLNNSLNVAEQLNTLVFIDTETTGFSAVRDRVIEVGALRVEKGKVVDSFSTVINPKIIIPDESYRITGIKKKEVKVAPEFKEIKQRLSNMLKGALFVAHNAKFDYDFIEQEFLRLDSPFSANSLCTVKLSRALYPHYPKHDLDSVSRRFKITVEKRHRAFDDAAALWELLQIFQSKFSKEKLEYVIASLIVPGKKIAINNAISQIGLI